MVGALLLRTPSKKHHWHTGIAVQQLVPAKSGENHGTRGLQASFSGFHFHGKSGLLMVLQGFWEDFHVFSCTVPPHTQPLHWALNPVYLYFSIS